MSAEREMRALLRAIVRNGYAAQDSYEDPICFYCRADHNGRHAKHNDGCLFVRAKELIAKHKAAQSGAMEG